MKSDQKHLVLIGGGHSHALVIRHFGLKPIAGTQITLISEQTLTPYSGMLPGFVAGHYSYLDAHINLERLCQWAGVRYICGKVDGIDPNAGSISIERNTERNTESETKVEYDILSIDIGSTPDLSIPGAREYAVGVKPVSHFGNTWNDLLNSSHDGGDWGVVGAGAGGVELVLAMAYRLKQNEQLNFHLFFPEARVLPGYPDKVVSVAEAALAKSHITLHPNFFVSEVKAGELVSNNGDAVSRVKSIWCTGATAAQWLSKTGLKTSAKGFIEVNHYLQSESHDNVFAAGDCADMLFDPRPKAGVYAVRQAPYLAHNLRAFCSGDKQSLKIVNLQSDFLSLLSLGEKAAVGCRNGITFKGRWVWQLKNYIDQSFMRRLNK